MMDNLMITDLTMGEKLAFLACFLMSGDMTSNEYLREVRIMIPGDEPIDSLIERATDWDCVNRMLGNPSSGPWLS